MVTAMAEFCIHEKHGGICEKTDTYCNIGACPYEDLKEYAPVRHGRWIASHNEFYACSICKYPVYAGWNQTNYCPNCGARMNEEVKHER